MKKSLLSLAFLCAAGMAAAVATSVRNISPVALYVDTKLRMRAAWDWLVALVLSPFAAAAKAEKRKALPGPLVALLAAKQYLLRQVKRERPLLSASWRLNPST